MEDIQLINESGSTFTVVSSSSYSTGVYKNREIWYCAAYIKIETKSYAGGQFEGCWEFTFLRDNVSTYIEQLTKMHSNLSGSIRIEDSESDANVSLEMVERGHVAVYGHIGGTHTENYLTFKYETDQTVLPGFINFMKSLL
jgi:hypothetical protein